MSYIINHGPFLFLLCWNRVVDKRQKYSVRFHLKLKSTKTLCYHNKFCISWSDRCLVYVCIKDFFYSHGLGIVCGVFYSTLLCVQPFWHYFPLCTILNAIKMLLYIPVFFSMVHSTTHVTSLYPVWSLPTSKWVVAVCRFSGKFCALFQRIKKIMYNYMHVITNMDGNGT